MLGLKLNHVSKRGHRCIYILDLAKQSYQRFQWIGTRVTSRFHETLTQCFVWVIFSKLTLGVYKTSSAKEQEAYDAAVTGVFDTLDKVWICRRHGNFFNSNLQHNMISYSRLPQMQLKKLKTLCLCQYLTTFNHNTLLLKEGQLEFSW